MSPETEAIIERLKAEGDLLRNSGTNSIKEVKVELGKFNSVFTELNKSFDGLKDVAKGQSELAKQDAKLRAMSEKERQAFYDKEAQMAQREQELRNQDLVKQEKDRQARKRQDNFIYKKMDGLFSWFGKMFSMIGKILLVGAPFLYNFAVGYLNEKFGLELPDIATGAKNFATFLKNTDWDAVGNALKIIAGIGVAALAFRGAMVAATAALAAGRFLGSIPGRLAGRPRVPTVNPGVPPTPPRGVPTAPRNFTLDADGNPISNKTGQRLTGAARNTALRIAAEDAAANKRPGFLARQASRLRGPGLVAKGAGFLGGGLTAAAVLGLFDEENLSADALEAELLAQADRGSLLDQAGDVLVDTTISTAVGAGTGSLFAGVGALPGAISGAIWGFGSSIATKAGEAWRDWGDRGIDTLPNTVEQAIRNQGEFTEETTAQQVIDALTATNDVANQFLRDTAEEFNSMNSEVERLEAIKAAGAANGMFNVGTDGRSFTVGEGRLDRMIEDAKEERDLLQSQREASQNVIDRRLEEIQRQQAAIDEYNRQLAEYNEIQKQSQDALAEQMDSLASGAGGNPIMNNYYTQGGTNVFNNTSMSKTSASNVTSYALGYGGGSNGGPGFIAIPGLV